MQIKIEITDLIDGAKSVYYSTPYVKMNRFRENPDLEAARWAYARYRQNRFDTGFRDSEIIEVIYNGDRNITDLVKEMDDTFDLLKWRKEGYIK